LAAEHEISVALLASADGDEESLLEAHVALTNSFYYLGDENEGYEHATAAAGIYDGERHRDHAAIYGVDPGAISHVRLGQIGWQRGCTNEAQVRIDNALAIVEEAAHPMTQTFIFSNLGSLWHWARYYERSAHYVEETLALCSEYGFPFYRAWALVQRGNLLAHQGDAERGLAEIKEGMGMIESAQNHLIYPWFATLYAEALGVAGDPEHGLAILPEAVATMEKTGARYFEGYLYCAKGHLLRQAKLDSEAERAFEQSIAIAQRRGIRAQELKAAIGIGEIHRANGKTAEAAARLKTLYESFAGEPETPDLKDARLLLEAIP